jgi:tetratricopeptide (TPR) repeat protein
VKQDHLTLEQLANLLSGQLDPEAFLRQVLPHFLSKCRVCRERFEELRALQTSVGHWDERVAVFEGAEAPALLASLEDLPFSEQLRKVAEEEECQSWALCQLLVQRSLDLVFDQPAQAVDRAELAAFISLRLSAAYDVHWVLDLRARAHAHLGNARRVLGELRSAEAAFARAEEFLGSSMTGNEEVRAEILHLKSSLFCQQRRLDDALRLADESLVIYRDRKDAGGISTVLVKKAKIFEEQGDLETAIRLLREASGEIDVVQDVRLRAYARHNLVVCLAASGRYEEARDLLQEIKPVFQDVARPLDLVRLHWAEGRIDSGLQNDEAAEHTLWQVRTEFLQRNMAYDAALVSLDLSLILFRHGRTEEIKVLARELIAIFEAQDVRREVFAALYLLQRACEEERISVDLIQQLSRLIESELRRRSRR